MASLLGLDPATSAAVDKRSFRLVCLLRSRNASAAVDERSYIARERSVGVW